MDLNVPEFSHLPPPIPDKYGLIYLSQPDVEHFERYRIGGYHPVVIGDTFQNGRYQVVQKLGFGGYSMVWLARDVKLGCYVALKIQVANKVALDAEKSILLMLNGIDSNNSSHPGREFIVRLLDEFTINGPNGEHLCLVLELARCSIAACQDDYATSMFSVEAARSITAQLILGISYVHSLGILHGDLHPGNIFVRGSSIQDYTNLVEVFEQPPIMVPVKRYDGGPVEPHAPSQTALPLHYRTGASKVTNPFVCIADFETSVLLTDEPNPQLHTPIPYRAPESFFQEPITLAADIWTLGASLFRILGSCPLLQIWFGDGDDAIAECTTIMGLPPARWWKKWDNRKLFFEEDGTRLAKQTRDGGRSRPLQDRMWAMRRGTSPETCHWDYNAGEMHALHDMLKSMLAWEPIERPAAEQLLKCEYMVKWALPALQQQLLRRKERKPSAGVQVVSLFGGHHQIRTRV